MTFDELWFQYESVRSQLNDAAPKEGPVTSELPRYTILRQKYNKLTQIVLGHPDSFERVRCWMVDAKGNAAECGASPDLIAEMEDGILQEDRHKYVERFGALPSEVKSLMSSWNLTDSGGGCGCWHLGCHCTTVEAQDLCSELYTTFKHAIDSRLLVIERKLWSLSLAPSFTIMG
jgi:hypothetical protein